MGFAAKPFSCSPDQMILEKKKTYKRLYISSRFLQFASQQTTQAEPTDMDSFESIVLPTSVPTNQDGEPGGSGPYCVVFQNAAPAEVPSNQDGEPGGSGPYCVIA